MSKNKKRLFWLGLTLAWMGVLFYLSHQPVDRSRDLSLVFAERIREVFGLEGIGLGRLNHYVRKSAHFLAYMILAIIVINIFRLKGYGLLRSILLSLLISLAFALTDEFHQLFVEGRGGQLSDVVLDGYGAAFGIGVYSLLFGKRFKKN